MDDYVFNITNVVVLRQQKALIYKLHYLGKNLIFIIFLTLSLLISNPSPVCANDWLFYDALNQAMMSMNTAMSGTARTGNADMDFARIMISHHQGAVDMAKVELLYGTDSRLRRLAQEIIVTQQSEIELMQLALKHPLSSQSSSFQ